MKVKYDIKDLITDEFIFLEHLDCMPNTVGILNEEDKLVSYVSYVIEAGELDILFAETLPGYRGRYYCSSLISALVRVNNIISCKLVALNYASEKYFKDLVACSILPADTTII